MAESSNSGPGWIAGCVAALDESRTDPPARLRTIWIEGGARTALAGRWFGTRDPATGEVLARVCRADSTDADAAVLAARKALSGEWGEFAPAERSSLILRLADEVEAAAEDLAAIESKDTGKPLAAAGGDIRGVVATLRYNAGAADKLEGVTVPLGAAFVDYTELEPLGVTAHIVPWNFPLGMAVRSLAPALCAGCTAILKPAEQTPLSAAALGYLAGKAGIPPGVINVLTGYGEEAGEPLVRNPLVDGVTFTGSVETGRRVAALAGTSLKPVVLELGGKNPLIILRDADLCAAAETAIEGAFDNAGQVCSSVSRLILEEAIADEFLEILAARARQLSIGAGSENPDIGPLSSAEQLAKVTAYIEEARRAGARILLGGKRPPERPVGYFIKPTVIDRIDHSNPAAREEIFGPVITVFRVKDAGEAVRLANGLPYGLVAGVHTKNIGMALQVARRLEAGSVWINGWFIGGVQAPTGGIKQSGYGRERGLEGIRNYLRIKNIGIGIGDVDL